MNGLAKVALLGLLAATVGCQYLCPSAAQAQAMMEYGGLMAMPKGIPNASTVNAMTNPYRMVPGMTPQNGAAGSVGAGASGNSAVSVDALGNATVDPRKAQVLGIKTLKEFEQAKAKMAAKPPDLKMAEALLRDCISTRNSIWGYSDPAMPKMLNLLGDVYSQQKHTSQAEACYKNALIYITKKDGSGSYERVDTLAKLGALYSGTGSQKEAVPYFQQVAQIKERQSGVNSADAIKARLAWADAACAAGKPDAVTLYKGLMESLEKVDRSKAEYSQLQVALIKSYGELLKKDGKLDEATALATHFDKASTTSATGDTSATVETKSSVKTNSEVVVGPSASEQKAPNMVPAAAAPALLTPAANSSAEITGKSSSNSETTTIEQKLEAEHSSTGRRKHKAQ